MEWARRQLTEEEAIALHRSGRWQKWTDVQRAKFQLFQRRLCMPFEEWHRCMEVALDRPIWTHEFAFHASLIEEWYGKIPAPTMQQIIDKINCAKTIIVDFSGEFEGGEA
jgi:hypothetical protein